MTKEDIVNRCLEIYVETGHDVFIIHPDLWERYDFSTYQRHALNIVFFKKMISDNLSVDIDTVWSRPYGGRTDMYTKHDLNE
jgi:hypothetical protein